ncbi:MAG: RNA polymerase sigma factor [Chloroflexota bacterium]
MKDYTKYSDLELLALISEGAHSRDDAFKAVYVRYSAQVWGYCLYRSASRQDAEELMQDAWLKFFAAACEGKRTERILPLLFTIARNLAIDRFRKHEAKRNIKTDDFETCALEQIPDPECVENRVEREEFNNLVKVAINYLDDIYKEPMLLYWFGQLDYKEIAAVCKENEACIRMRITRAYKKLADLLKPVLTERKG